jgi:predicted HAD superfamily Cof-like phosphohydrolase
MPEAPKIEDNIVFRIGQELGALDKKLSTAVAGCVAQKDFMAAINQLTTKIDQVAATVTKRQDDKDKAVAQIKSLVDGHTAQVNALLRKVDVTA